MKTEIMLPCPFCGGPPTFEGDVDDWDDGHYCVSLSLVCCSKHTKSLGWREANHMSRQAKEKYLKDSLIAAWNTRTPIGLRPEVIDELMGMANNLFVLGRQGLIKTDVEVECAEDDLKLRLRGV